MKFKIGNCEVCKKELFYKEDYYLLWHPFKEEDRIFCSRECIKKGMEDDNNGIKEN